jgi:NTP pyrophosphatase (non-canonical NTP hydrolase)
VALGLTSEAGEVADVFKKTMRDNDAKWTEDRKKKLSEELGDVLWYAARIADEFDWNLQTIAELNLKKLQERKVNGEIHGR